MQRCASLQMQCQVHMGTESAAMCKKYTASYFTVHTKQHLISFPVNLHYRYPVYSLNYCQEQTPTLEIWDVKSLNLSTCMHSLWLKIYALPLVKSTCHI